MDLDTIRGFVILSFVFLFPHVPAVVAGFGPVRRTRLLVRLLFVLGPALLYFFITQYLFGTAADDIRAHGHYVCGAFGAVAVFTILGGTALHLLIGTAIQSVNAFSLYRLRRAPVLK